jgi:hypothetical protein
MITYDEVSQVFDAWSDSDCAEWLGDFATRSEAEVCLEVYTACEA